MNDMEQTEFDFSENQETEQERLEREVLAAGGRVGKVEGRFVFEFDEAEGYKRGDEHRGIEGLYFWMRNKQKRSSRWLSGGEFMRIGREEAIRKDKWQKNNKSKVNKRNKLWKAANIEHVRESCRRYRKNNKEKENLRQKEWRRANPDKVRARTARYNARKLKAIDITADQAVIDSRQSAATYLSDVTGYDWHVDHTVPISKGGKHHEGNLQVVPQSWNNSKKNYHDKRWIEDSNIYRYATAVEKRFEEEAKKNI